MAESKLSSSIQIRVNGEAMQQATGSNLIEALVDQHSHLPAMFSLRLSDPELRLLDHGLLNVGDEVEILSADSNGMTISLIKGAIIALDPVFGRNGSAEIRVRGYDKAHQMYRNVHSRTFLNVKDSDLASTIAEEWGLTAQVDTTTTVYPHIYQHNQSDLAFLFERAWRIGFECFVHDEILYFREPKPIGQPQVTLRWRENLLYFRPRMSHAEQANEVVVRGWDAKEKQPIVGRAATGKLFAKVKDSPIDHAANTLFGNGKLTIVDQPALSQAEADILANARMNELSGAFVNAEGIAFRQPNLRAGDEVKLEGLGQRFSGTFLITSAKHTFSAGEGFETKFEVSGTRRGMISDQMQSRKNARWYGIYPAVVVGNNDPLNAGRVKVTFPWLDEGSTDATRADPESADQGSANAGGDGQQSALPGSETDWLRMVSFGTSGNSGLFMPPSVNDQVIVAFEHGDFNRPIVLGTLPKPVTENVADDPEPNQAPPTEGVSEEGRTTMGRWRSPYGSAITMHDSLTKKSVEISTKSGHKIEIDEENGNITLSTKGALTGYSPVEIDTDTGSILSRMLEVGQTIRLDANTQSISIESPGPMGTIDLSAKIVTVNGSPIPGII